MATPDPTPIYRITHFDNLRTVLKRRGLHSPNAWPNDGLPYRMAHNQQVQGSRGSMPIRCGPGGVLHDYVPFYFGYLSVMLLNLKTGRVEGYDEGQEPIVYLVSNAQAVKDSGAGFVFSDGHGLAHYSDWFDDLGSLGAVDWDLVYERYWSNTDVDFDRQRRKQAEFLVHEFMDWQLIEEVAVFDDDHKEQAERVMSRFGKSLRRPVVVRRDWYYW